MVRRHLLGCEAALGEYELGEVTRRDEVHHEHEELDVLEGVLHVWARGRRGDLRVVHHVGVACAVTHTAGCAGVAASARP